MMILASAFAGVTNRKFEADQFRVEELKWRMMRELIVGEISCCDQEERMVIQKHEQKVYIIRMVRATYRGVLRHLILD